MNRNNNDDNNNNNYCRGYNDFAPVV